MEGFLCYRSGGLILILEGLIFGILQYIGEDDHGKLLLIYSLYSKHFCTSLLFHFFCSCCNFAITRLETLATQGG